MSSFPTLKSLAVAGFIAVAGPLVLAACAPVEMALDDRSAGEIYRDSELKARALSRIGGTNEGWFHDVDIDVWRGRVLLTGLVESPSVRRSIVDIVKGVEGTSSLYDHLEIISPKEARARRAEREKNETGDGQTYVTTEETLDLVSDNWIEGKVRVALLNAVGSRQANYRWRSVRGKVYLLGESADQTELDAVLLAVRSLANVKEVTSYIQIAGAAN